MIPLTATAIAACTGGRVIGDGSRTITTVCTDTRTRSAMSETTLFAALRGETRDGHRFVDEAVEQGVGAVLVDRAVSSAPVAIEVADTAEALARLARTVRDAVDPRVVAITGSVGKTTVKDLIAHALSSTMRVVSSNASFNNELGVPLTMLELAADTEALVVEIGARHRGDIAPLAALVRPDVAVVTAVAGVHLEIFGSLAAIAATKGELVDALDADGVAVLNIAWPLVAAMESAAPRAVRVGDGGDVWASDVRLDDRAHAHFVAHTPYGDAPVGAPLAGRHQVDNVLLALAVSGELGVPLDVAAAAIASAEVQPMRGQIVELDGRTVIDDTYNANPTAVRAALEVLVAIADGRPTVAVLGEMAEIGRTSVAEHEAIGRACAAHGVAQVVACGTAAEPIAAGARDGGVTEVVALPSAQDAAEWVWQQSPENAVILVKASRVARLETVVENLRERAATSDPSGGVRA